MVWTAEEISAYIPPVTHPLSSLYRMASIDAGDPEKRAQYLAEKVLQLTLTDHDLLMRMAKEKGRVSALQDLEQMFLSCVEGKNHFIEAVLENGGDIE